ASQRRRDLAAALPTPRRRWCRAGSSQIGRSWPIIPALDLESRSAEWRRGEELREIAASLRLFLPFLRRYDNGRRSSMPRNDLRPFRLRLLDQLAEPRFGLGNRPVSFAH